MKPHTLQHIQSSITYLKEAQDFAKTEADPHIRAMHFQVIDALTNSLETAVNLIEA